MRARRGRRSVCAPLGLAEVLERRALMSTDTWQNTVDGPSSYEQASNWSIGAVPGPVDVATFTAAQTAKAAIGFSADESAGSVSVADPGFKVVAGAPLHLQHHTLAVANALNVGVNGSGSLGIVGIDESLLPAGTVDVAVERQGRPLTELGAGAHFGEMALVNDAPRSATVVAREQMDLLVIGRPEMMGLMRVDPVLAVKILWTLVQSLSSRLRATSAEVELADPPRDTIPAPFPQRE